MKMSVEVTLKLRTKEVIQSIEKTASKRIHEGVDAVKGSMLETLSGNRSGRTYKVPGTNRTYRASSPGKPPAQATGRLRQSLKTSVGEEKGMIVGIAGTSLPYGLMLDKGTRGGKTIYPRKGKFLVFEVDGKKVFAKKVVQGPIAPRPWLMPSLRKALPALRRIFAKPWL